MSRPELPKSYVVDLNSVVNLIPFAAHADGTGTPYSRYDMDVIIPVYESFNEEIAKNIVWLLDRKIYRSNKSRFVEPLKTVQPGGDTYYIYDKFKSDSYSHKKSYKQFMVEVPYHEKDVEPLYIPVYWRVN